MSLEDLTGSNKFITNLVNTNPLSADDRREGDDHIRGIKNVLHNTFPQLDGPVDFTAADMTAGIGSGKNAVQKGGDTMTGALLLPDGTAAAPALAFASEATLGLWRTGAAAARLEGNLAVSHNLYGQAYGLDAAVVASQDANYVYKAFSGANWLWQWTKANGRLTWLRPGAAPATVFKENGDFSAGRDVYPGNSAFPALISSKAGFPNIQFAADGWRWEFTGANGRMSYVNSLNAEQIIFDNVGNAYKASGAGSWLGISSDARVKEQIQYYDAGLQEVLALQPRTFVYKAAAGMGSERHIGFIAQEVLEAMPDMARAAPVTRLGDLEFEDLLTVDEGPLIYALVNAIKELHLRIEQLEAQLGWGT